MRVMFSDTCMSWFLQYGRVDGIDPLGLGVMSLRGGEPSHARYAVGSSPERPDKSNPLDAPGAGISRLPHASLRFLIADRETSPRPLEEIRRHRAEPKHEVTLA